MDSLQQALTETGLKNLPPEYKGSGIWILALAKVAKSNGQRDWAIARYDGECVNFVKVFGAPAQIVRAESLHPYRFLRSQEMPTFSDSDSVVRFLATFGFELSDILAATKSERNRMVIIASIRYAVEKDKTLKKYFANLKKIRKYK